MPKRTDLNHGFFIEQRRLISSRWHRVDPDIIRACSERRYDNDAGFDSIDEAVVVMNAVRKYHRPADGIIKHETIFHGVLLRVVEEQVTTVRYVIAINVDMCDEHYETDLGVFDE